MTTRRTAGLAGLTAAALAAGGLAPVATGTAGAAEAPSFVEVGRYDTGAANGTDTAAEIVAYENGTLYVLVPRGLDVVDLRDPASPRLLRRLALPVDPTSVAVSDGLVAVALPAADRVSPGTVRFLRGERQVGEVTVGSLPDMVTFTPDGARLLVANEGEPDGYGQPGSVDPEGSVSVITTQPFRTPAALRRPSPAQPVATIDFRGFDAPGALPAGVRISGPGASVSQDLEPEYVTVADDSRTAWVTLQENDAVARLDLTTLTVDRLTALEDADHSRPGAALDPSDRDGGIRIGTWPVRGLRMPDGIADFRSGGQTYLLTANEGDAREYPGHSDVARAATVADTAAVPQAGVAAQLGRLNVVTTAPATRTATGRLGSLYAFGSRSFSVRDADGALVWDSGEELERLVARVLPQAFNASNSNDELDNRSDDKGPEPESVATGRVGDRQLAFVALERIGGVVVYDVTDPRAPQLLQYLTTRVFDGAPVGPDSGAEGLAFVPAAQSPTGQALLVVGNEVTGTVNVWSAR